VLSARVQRRHPALVFVRGRVPPPRAQPQRCIEVQRKLDELLVRQVRERRIDHDPMNIVVVPIQREQPSHEQSPIRLARSGVQVEIRWSPSASPMDGPHDARDAHPDGTSPGLDQQSRSINAHHAACRSLTGDPQPEVPRQALGDRGRLVARPDHRLRRPVHLRPLDLERASHQRRQVALCDDQRARGFFAFVGQFHPPRRCQSVRRVPLPR